ncbi:phasin family protein [Microvirga sp. ACRRW]|uniref:phasin family protein n=1 Tax=Microvirga sp. ACRRW TaxID=2918205 RepID=UPI001EF7306D|nr:phasin family protein [Microvirga sp. ACRRW]MCG7394281.1 phasin family protein [Microvirga sp. ACRRW]
MTSMSKTSRLSDAMRSTHELALSGEGSRALAVATETWFSAAAECQREMMGFVSMRLEKDGETTREIMACKTPTDAAAIQTRWLEETLRDYNAEMTKLMTICTKYANGGARTGR